MEPRRWQKVKTVFEEAIELPRTARLEFLDHACREDVGLRSEVERLLDSFDQGGSFMERPAANEVASEIVQPRGLCESGQTFSHYEIIRQIGVGGMGEVYLAADKKLDRQVAIKVLNEKFAQHESDVQRFVREAKAASSLNHPNILVVHEIHVSESVSYIVGEFVAGRTLREVLNISPLGTREALDIVVQIAAALAAAHKERIIHRDIKPENVMVRPDGYVKVLDFGLAKLIHDEPLLGEDDATKIQNQTAKGVIMGTVSYMSPEQAKGEPVDARTDIFSLGVLMYELLAGRTPFHGNSMSETFANLINADPPPLAQFAPNVPDELVRMIEKALRKSKEERYAQVADLHDDLKRLRSRMDFESHLESRPAGHVASTSNQRRIESSQMRGFTNSIAVMPFSNMSSDPENEYLCDGVAEELLIALTKISDIKVAARTSSFSFKGRNVNLEEISRALNVNTILEGSIRRSGDQLRIAVQLVSAVDGYHIWSERYDGDIKDIFDLQDRITLSVIGELKVKFRSEEIDLVRDRYAENVEAYQLYLKGRFHFLNLTPTETWKGISYFEQAIAIDPNYALAHAGLAHAYETLPLTSDAPAAEFFSKAKESALTAIGIDDSISEAYSALAWTSIWYDWDFDQAELHARRAVEVAPNNSAAREALGQALTHVGKFGEAIDEMRRARELDPLNLRITALEAQTLHFAGRYDEALDRTERALDLAPNFWLAHLFAAGAYIEKGMYGEAITSARMARDFSSSTHPIAFLGYALVKSGDHAGARRELQELKNLSAKQYVPAPHFAMIHNGLGEIDDALTWLERAEKEHDARLGFLKVEPKWNALRNEERFRDILSRVGFRPDAIKPTDPS